MATIARRWLGVLLVLGTVLLSTTFTQEADARRPAPAAPRVVPPVTDITLAELPKEVRDTVASIRGRGPFPFVRDGAVFYNREGILPRQPHGYYTEYTVRTPGTRKRGARRIVAGQGATGDPATSGEYYYTADHYATFQRIRG